jgi:hypothetical protein
VRRLGLAFAIAATGLAVAGCNDPASVVSCTISSPSDAGAPFTVCQEFAGLSRNDQDTWGRSCIVSHGSTEAPVDASADFEYGPCARARALGGCRPAGSSSLTTWYYDEGPNSLAGIMMLCAQIGGTFVAP